MRKFLILLFTIFPILLFSQQINYDWGYNTSGTAYNQSGVADLDSNGTITIIYDLQDYYFMDWNPLALDSVTVLYNSDALFLGTFWYRWDLQNAADSIMFTIKAYPGNMIYHPNDGSRITTSNINFSTTAITIVDTTAGTYTTNDIQWTGANVYLNASVRMLPSEFLKIVMDLEQVSCDSIDGYWNFAYPAVYEDSQTDRTTTRSKRESRKKKPTLH